MPKAANRAANRYVFTPAFGNSLGESGLLSDLPELADAEALADAFPADEDALEEAEALPAVATAEAEPD